MSISNKTADDLTSVLVEEVGVYKALKIIARLIRETTGNKSYRESLRMAQKKLIDSVQDE